MTDPSTPMGPTPNDKPADTLRDARLALALQHMPDAHMHPSVQTRSAVLQEALRAVGTGTHAQPVVSQTPMTPTPIQHRWWHAWLGQPGQRVPWVAAVASVAIFGFITVMWYGQTVPDAAPERSAAVAHKADTGADAQGDAQAQGDATAKSSDKKLAETGAQQATNAAVPSAVVPEHKLAKVTPSEAPKATAPAVHNAAPVAPTELARARAAAPTAAPATPPVADVMVEAAAPAAPVAAPTAAAAPRVAAAANVATAADAPTAQARLERRSKAMQAEIAAASPPMAALGAAPAKARADAGSVWVLSLGDAQRTIRPEQAQKLLSQLRGLSYAPVSVSAPSVDRPADAIRLDRAGIETWVITPGYVTHYRTGAGAAAGVAAPSGVAADARGTVAVQGDAPLRSAITPAQYSDLRRLAMALGAEPSHPSAP